jgi:uncharacterized protein (DUF1684 family)
MRNGKIFVVLLAISIFLPIQGLSVTGSGEDQGDLRLQEKRVLEWRKERDEFFRTHQRSPLAPKDRGNFKSLKYYPFNPKYTFSGQIERYILHIDNPKYYATFLTNKGTNKRYLRYGKFHFKLDGKKYVLEIYKSILSDTLFVPFKDKTNGKESYEGGRYIDTEIQPGYKMDLDFNMAYHPSCAYNEKFICVLTPRENMLEVEIKAGEKNLK